MSVLVFAGQEDLVYMKDIQEGSLKRWGEPEKET